MRIAIEPDSETASSHVARLIADRLCRRPRTILGTATGSTMEAVYAKLAQLHREGAVSLREATAFSLDEYVGVGREETWSFYSFLRSRLVETTDLPLASLYAPDGLAADLCAEARRYEAELDAASGIDLQLLGLGRNGHIGFNEPGSSLGSRTRVKALTRDTLEANGADLPALGAAAPVAAITLGLGSILASRHALLLAVGEHKAGAVAAMAEGPVTARVPASILQHHPSVTVVLDEAAATRLEARDYYRSAEALQRELEPLLPPR